MIDAQRFPFIERLDEFGTPDAVPSLPLTLTYRNNSIEVSGLQAENIDADTFARELCILAAVKLYELGRLSSGRAAELAGMSRVEFMMNLGRYKVFPLEAELQNLEGQSLTSL